MFQSWINFLFLWDQLTQCTYKAKGEIMRISKGALIVMKGQKINGLLYIAG